ncbi:hypothetical protein OSTOST_24639, partial [Ostertagia ostertagi]
MIRKILKYCLEPGPVRLPLKHEPVIHPRKTSSTLPTGIARAEQAEAKRKNTFNLSPDDGADSGGWIPGWKPWMGVGPAAPPSWYKVAMKLQMDKKTTRLNGLDGPYTT